MRADSASASTQYFNSIKVRLERTWTEDFIDQDTFQFHKGAIRTYGT